MKSLRDRIARYMQVHHTVFIPKGVICDLARNSNLKATGEHVGRRLRELEEDGVLEVRYNKKGQAEYKFKGELYAPPNTLPTYTQLHM